jgi:hypothetical protein
VVGDLHLTFEAMDLPADPGLSIVAYSAEPGSGSEDALTLLASWAATTLDQTEVANPTEAPERALGRTEDKGKKVEWAGHITEAEYGGK